MADHRYCSNCRAELKGGTGTCPSCGVFAGDVFDGRKPKRKSRLPGILFALAVLVVLAIGAATFVQVGGKLPFQTSRTETVSTRVVGDRPGGARTGSGATVSEAEALRLVRSHLVRTRSMKADCLALMSRGYKGEVYVIHAFDRCSSTNLGSWTVNGKTSKVAPQSN